MGTKIRCFEQAERSRDAEGDQRGDHESRAEKHAQHAEHGEDLGSLFDHLSTGVPQTSPDEDENHARLSRPENPVDRGADWEWPWPDRDGSRFEELTAGGRLNVGQQILVRGEAVEQLRVRIRVNL